MTRSSAVSPVWRRWAKRLGVWFHQMSLFQRLVLGGVMAAVVVAAAFYVTQVAARAVEQRILAERLEAAQITAEVLDATIAHMVGEMESAARVLEGSSTSAGQLIYPRRLARLQEELLADGFVAIALLDATGNVVDGAPPERLHEIGTPAARVPSLADALSGNGPFISPVFRDPVEGSALLLVVVPVYADIPGARTPYLMGLVNPAEMGIQSTLSSVAGVMHTGHADLLDSNGLVVASTEEENPLTAGDHPAFYQAMRVSPTVTIETVPYLEGQKEDHVMAYVPLAHAPFAVSAGAIEGETFAAVKAFKQRVGILAGGLLVVALGGIVLGAARLVGPVQLLSVAARRMAGGDLSTGVSVREGGEIGDLAQDLEIMRTRLSTSLAQLQAMNEELEHRVAQRTAELQQRNRELEAASGIAEKVTSFMQLDEVLEHTLEGVAEATGQPSVAIFLRDPQEAKLVLRAGRGLRTPLAEHESSVAVGTCLCGQVAATGEAMVVGDVQGSPLVTLPVCLKAGVRCVASFPLMSRDQVEGVLVIFSPQPNSLTGHDFGVVNIICHQVGVAIQNARMYEEVQENEKLAHHLLDKVITAQEEERRRLAQELHDDTGQALTGIALALDSLGGSLPPGQEGTRRRLKELHQTTQEAMRELRRMALALRPGVLDDLGLVPAVRRYAVQNLEPVGATVEVQADGFDRRLDPAVETLLFRVFQEAINNVARHSKARNVTVTLRLDNDEIQGTVEDDGVGFDAQALRRGHRPSAGLGLLGMQERASLLGGRVAVESSPGEGTRVHIWLPYRPGEPGQ
ncbi:MAG: GAF domain-containing protein [Chloroflexi bacterium]|nr:GAF domain-containing protein [Chloroflexota bacterium]